MSPILVGLDLSLSGCWWPPCQLLSHQAILFTSSSSSSNCFCVTFFIKNHIKTTPPASPEPFQPFPAHPLSLIVMWLLVEARWIGPPIKMVLLLVTESHGLALWHHHPPIAFFHKKNIITHIAPRLPSSPIPPTTCYHCLWCGWGVQTDGPINTLLESHHCAM